MSQYQHAAKIKRYAQDAVETAEPWKRWSNLVDGEVTGPCTYPICDFSSVIRIAGPHKNTYPHPHADLLMQLAEDCSQHWAPYRQWEVLRDLEGRVYPLIVVETGRAGEGKWERYGSRSNLSAGGSLKALLYDIHKGNACRRWVARIGINGLEIPYLATTPEDGQAVFYPDLVVGVSGFTWDGSDAQIRMLEQKLLHSTSEEAKLHYQALTSF